MTIKNIPNFIAVDLAHAYHEVMVMVENRSSFHCSKSPRKTLEDYLAACSKAGVCLHNDLWLERAHEVIEELEQRRRDALDMIRQNVSKSREVSA